MSKRKKETFENNKQVNTGKRVKALPSSQEKFSTSEEIQLMKLEMGMMTSQICQLQEVVSDLMVKQNMHVALFYHLFKSDNKGDKLPPQPPATSNLLQQQLQQDQKSWALETMNNLFGVSTQAHDDAGESNGLADKNQHIVTTGQRDDAVVGERNSSNTKSHFLVNPWHKKAICGLNSVGEFEIVQCEYCNKIFRSPNLLQLHLVDHHSGSHTCDMCKVPYSTREHLRVHYKNIHQLELLAVELDKL